MLDIAQGLSLVSTITGSAVISLGMVLQKKGIAWLSHSGEKTAQYRKQRATWITGMVLNNLLVVFYYLGLRGLSASIVGAMMGLNIVFTALFSKLFLHEKIGKRVIWWSSLLVLGIVAANVFAVSTDTERTPPGQLIYIFFSVPYIVVLCGFFLTKYHKMKEQVFAGFFAAGAGFLEGFVIILVKSIQAFKGDKILEYFVTPYLYLYVFSTVSVLVMLQFAYAKGRIVKFGPILWGTQIVWPVFMSYILFQTPVDMAQMSAFCLIAVSVIMVQIQK